MHTSPCCGLQPYRLLVGISPNHLKANSNRNSNPKTLIKKTIKLINKYFDKKVDILDIGTGSGCIAISLAKYINDAIKDNDVNSKKIEYTNAITGKTEVGFAEQGSQKEINGYESDLKLIMVKLEQQLSMIEQSGGRDSEKLNMKGEVLLSAANQISDLQVAYGVIEMSAVDEHTDRAMDAFSASEEAKVKEGFLDAGKAVLGAFTGKGKDDDDELDMFGRPKVPGKLEH